jgi:cytochrome c peroxidase
MVAASGKLQVPLRSHLAQSAAGPDVPSDHFPAQAAIVRELLKGRRLFERETFAGNGRTCLTCHSRETGTVSPRDARRRFRKDSNDPLFVHDGSDDEDGDGFGDGQQATRMLKDATVLMRIALCPEANRPNNR